MSEIMQDKAQSLATFLNWGINLLISYYIPIIKAKIGDEKVGYIFIFMGGTSFIGSAFIAFFVIETKGKSQKEIEALFRKNNKTEIDSFLANNDA